MHDEEGGDDDCEVHDDDDEDVTGCEDDWPLEDEHGRCHLKYITHTHWRWMGQHTSQHKHNNGRSGHTKFLRLEEKRFLRINLSKLTVLIYHHAWHYKGSKPEANLNRGLKNILIKYVKPYFWSFLSLPKSMEMSTYCPSRQYLTIQ